MADVRCPRCGTAMVLTVQRPEGPMNEPPQPRFQARWACPSPQCRPPG